MMITKQTSVQAIWQDYFATKSIRSRNLLVEYYTPLVHKQAARLFHKMPSQVSYDELCSAGYDGLIEAVQAYDPDRKAMFETFCQKRIIGAIMDWLRSLDPQSRTVRNFEKKRFNMQEILNTKLDRPPNHDELAESMGMDRRRYNLFARISQIGHEVHFSSMESRSGANFKGHMDDWAWNVPDNRTNDPSAKIARRMLTDCITRGLSSEERLILILYYYEDLTMFEIGRVLDVSESRVCQLHKEVIARLRNRLKGKPKEEYLVA